LTGNSEDDIKVSYFRVPKGVIGNPVRVDTTRFGSGPAAVTGTKADKATELRFGKAGE
jgi:hypothetical protein